MCLQGMVRGPRNRIRGVRSAWTAACRRTLVAYIVDCMSRLCAERGVELSRVDKSRGHDSGVVVGVDSVHTRLEGWIYGGLRFNVQQAAGKGL